MFNCSNLISLHLFLLNQISFNVLYMKKKYQFTSNTVEQKMCYQKQILLI